MIIYRCKKHYNYFQAYLQNLKTHKNNKIITNAKL